MTDKPQKIVRFEAQNMMRLRAVEITPEGGLVVVGGRNSQGKSSVLNSIAMALGGEREVPAEPVRRGQDDGQVVLELDDITVSRRFTAGRMSKLEVKAKEGYKLGTPQKILDSLMGGLKKLRLTFDPLEFVRAEPRKQLEVLKQIVTVDLAGLDARRQEFFVERAETNREVKRLQGAMGTVPIHDVPTEEVSVAELVRERNLLVEENHDSQVARMRADDRQLNLDAKANELIQARKAVSRLEEEVALAEKAAIKAAKVVGGLEDHDLGALDERIDAAEEVNRMVRENAEHARLGAEREKREKESRKLTAKIEAIDEERARKLAEAPFPVDGLGFGEGGITFDDLPFEQASQAEQLRVAVAVGLATNSGLRVLLIRDGSLLDDENLALLARMAKDAEAQLWVERVGEGEECTVVIEDGQVKP